MSRRFSWILLTVAVGTLWGYSTDSSAQDFTLKFESSLGHRYPDFTEHFANEQDLDLDNDGVPEIVTESYDSQSLHAFSATSGAEVWSLQFSDNEYPHHMGFFDFDGDGTKEALVDGSDGGYNYWIRVYSTTSGEILLDIPGSSEVFCLDADGDGLKDLFVGFWDPDVLVQVWGWGTASSVPDGRRELPNAKSLLGQNRPNPFNPRTHISYEVQAPGRCRLRIFDIQGRPVRTLVDDIVRPGEFLASWDGKDDEGRRLASGTYFYQLTVGDFVASKKMVMLR